jgi:large subunit ribosomal protein L25
MAEIVVSAEKRRELGKNANRRIRSLGKIPAVVYGRGVEATAISVDPRDVHRILHSETGHNTIFKLRVDSDATDVLIKDYQLDPVRDSLLHADFQVISMDRKMTFEVPIQAVGTASGVKTGGILDTVLREIQVECLPGDVPDHIRVDVTELDIGDSVRVAELQVETSRVNMISEPDLVVLTVVAPHVEAEPEVEEEEVAEPELVGANGEEEEKEEQAKEE